MPFMLIRFAGGIEMRIAIADQPDLAVEYAGQSGVFGITPRRAGGRGSHMQLIGVILESIDDNTAVPFACGRPWPRKHEIEKNARRAARIVRGHSKRVPVLEHRRSSDIESEGPDGQRASRCGPYFKDVAARKIRAAFIAIGEPAATTHRRSQAGQSRSRGFSYAERPPLLVRTQHGA
jgi:hypothetical protein